MSNNIHRVFEACQRCANDLAANGRSAAFKSGISNEYCNTLLRWHLIGCPRDIAWLNRLVDGWDAA